MHGSAFSQKEVRCTVVHLASEVYNIFCFSESVINGPDSWVCGSTFNNKREVKCAVAHLASEDYNTVRFLRAL